MNSEEHFWKRVDKKEIDACLLWRGAKFTNGYGCIGIGRKCRGTHRVAWELTHGKIPNGLFVLHKCDNKPCVNPAHLWLGTHKDNMADMVAKGRQASGDRNSSRQHPERLRFVRGVDHGQAKLTEASVVAIRSATGTQVSIAKIFGISQSVVSQIRSRQLWAHVP